MDKIIYVGTKPGNFPPDRSPTIRRITKWSNEAGVDNWDWTNLSDPNMLDKIKGCKVIAMGNDVANYFSKTDIPFLKVPHPSGLNRMQMKARESIQPEGVPVNPGVNASTREPLRL